IQCLVTFDKYFYELLMQFIVEKDPIPHIKLDNHLDQPLAGQYAYKMPDKTSEWIKTLNEDDFSELFSSLERE
ncbi:2922_t:CDS:2, partial [Cetraspora pellucida]